MTPKTQSVCKHCQRKIEPCIGRVKDLDECSFKGWLHIESTSHWCNFEPNATMAEPVSTGEPPPYCPVLGCPRYYGQNVPHDHTTLKAARPSEPSAPPCDCSAGKNARLYEHHRDCHWLQFVTRPENNPAAPQTSGEPTCGKPAASLIPRLGMSWACALPPNHEGACCPGGNCVKHGKYICKPNEQPQCPKWPDCISAAAPLPVSGDAPPVTRLPLVIEGENHGKDGRVQITGGIASQAADKFSSDTANENIEQDYILDEGGL